MKKSKEKPPYEMLDDGIYYNHIKFVGFNRKESENKHRAILKVFGWQWLKDSFIFLLNEWLDRVMVKNNIKFDDVTMMQKGFTEGLKILEEEGIKTVRFVKPKQKKEE